MLFILCSDGSAFYLGQIAGFVFEAGPWTARWETARPYVRGGLLTYPICDGHHVMVARTEPRRARGPPDTGPRTAPRDAGTARRLHGCRAPLGMG